MITAELRRAILAAAGPDGAEDGDPLLRPGPAPGAGIRLIEVPADRAAGTTLRERLLAVTSRAVMSRAVTAR